MNTKRIFALLVTGLTTLVNLTASSYDCCDPCDSNRFQVGVDFIYWSACTPSLEYAQVNTPSTEILELGYVSIDGQYNEHYFEPGFRLFASVDDLWCGWDLAASYTRYKSTDKKIFAREGNLGVALVYAIPALGLLPPTFPARIIGKSEIEYQSIDVLLGVDFNCFGPCHTAGAFFGIEGIKLDQRNQAFAQTESRDPNGNIIYTDEFTIDWNSEFKGIGPKIGTQYEWQCCNCLNWFAKGSFSVLVGDQDDRNSQSETSASRTRNIKDCSTLCVPGLHLAAGIDYSTCYCGWDFGVRLGYEFINWWNIPQQRTYASTSQYEYATPSAGGNFVLHGLFAGAYLTF